MRRTFVERNLARFASVLQESVLMEESAAANGWLQRMDPRVKVTGFLALLAASAFSHSMIVIAVIYVLTLFLAGGSRLFTLSFFRRTWIFMPFYSALIAIPALFLTPGNSWIRIGSVVISEQGARTATFLVLRVATSVSFMLLLVSTTSWPRLLKALRSLRFPRLLIFLLAMTYRYIYVLLQTANSLFLARTSRRVGPETWQNTGRWTGAILTSLLGKSVHLSNEVYLAMQSRGFRGEPVIFQDFRMKRSDAGWLIFLLLFAACSLYFGTWRNL